jgi:hypothetical protein
MNHSLKLSIPEPCHENWANMSVTEKGKFCGACQKQVIDFTGLSDAALAEYFTKKNNTGVCGRMNAHQVNKPLLPAVPKNRLVHYVLKFTIPALLFSCNNEVQGKVRVGEIGVVSEPQNETVSPGNITPPKMRKITGKVTDSEGAGVAHIVVTIKNTDYSAITNERGEYTIEYAGTNNKPVIEVNQFGYAPFSKKISIGQKNNSVAKIGICLKPATENPAVIMGLIITPQKK